VTAGLQDRRPRRAATGAPFCSTYGARADRPLFLRARVSTFVETLYRNIDIFVLARCDRLSRTKRAADAAACNNVDEHFDADIFV
jgi:hypothetical protein